MKKIIDVTFILMGIGYLLFIPDNQTTVNVIMKIIPIILLVVMTFLAHTSYTKWIRIGLVFSLIADGAIIFYFIAGLAFFLLAHLFYIRAFLLHKERKVPMHIGIPLILYAIAIGIWLVSHIWQDDLFLAFAVAMYVTVIFLMGWTAVQTNNKPAIIGAFLFILSDSVLGVNEFIFDVPFARYILMVLYYSAQLFIATSVLTMGKRKRGIR